MCQTSYDIFIDVHQREFSWDLARGLFRGFMFSRIRVLAFRVSVLRKTMPDQQIQMSPGVLCLEKLDNLLHGNGMTLEAA